MQLLDGVKLCSLNELNRSKLKPQAAMSRFRQKLWNSVPQVWRSKFWGIWPLWWAQCYDSPIPKHGVKISVVWWLDQWLLSYGQSPALSEDILINTCSVFRHTCSFKIVMSMMYTTFGDDWVKFEKRLLYLFFQLMRTSKKSIMADLCSKASWVLSQFVIDLTHLHQSMWHFRCQLILIPRVFTPKMVKLCPLDFQFCSCCIWFPLWVVVKMLW